MINRKVSRDHFIGSASGSDVGLRMDAEHIVIRDPVRRLDVFAGSRPRTSRNGDVARIVAEIATKRKLGLCRGSTS
jgi:hypothetical protein